MNIMTEEEVLNEILTAKYQKRFWSKISVKSKDECWKWTVKSRMSGGRYGLVRVKTDHFGSHQVAYMIYYGKSVAKGMAVRHSKSCDNGLCCNPLHLSEGTPYENMDDMFNAFRHTSQKKEREAQVRVALKKLTSNERELLFCILSEEIKKAPQA